MILDELGLESLIERVVRRVVREEHAATAATVEAFTVESAAATTGRSAKSIRKAIAAGALKATRPAGSRLWAIRPEDLAAWLSGDGGGQVDDLARRIVERRRRA